jgi:hypothetical protein
MAGDNAEPFDGVSTFQRLWKWATGQPGYNKRTWATLQSEIEKNASDARDMVAKANKKALDETNAREAIAKDAVKHLKENVAYRNEINGAIEALGILFGMPDPPVTLAMMTELAAIRHATGEAKLKEVTASRDGYKDENKEMREYLTKLEDDKHLADPGPMKDLLDDLNKLALLAGDLGSTARSILKRHEEREEKKAFEKMGRVMGEKPIIPLAPIIVGEEPKA